MDTRRKADSRSGSPFSTAAPRERAKLPPEERAREICLAALERRMRSRHELEIRLRQKRIPAEIAAAVLERLVEVGLVNDEEYARAFVASRQRAKPRGARGLSSELARRGVPREIIDKVLEDLGETEDFVDSARRAIAPKLRSLAARPPAEARRKAEQFLLRRGFSYGVAREVLDELLGDGGED